jgi:peptidyl-prolyl cis-trans isomerase B (cyclophilin B)
MENEHGHGRSFACGILAAVAIGAMLVSAIGCGGSGDASTTTASAPGHDPATTTSASDCKHVEPSKVKSASYRAPEQVVKAGERLTALVRTSCGTFEIRLNAKRSPTTVNSFVFLAEKGFYDGLGFERASIDSYLEGGKPAGGAGGPGYSVRGEMPPGFIYRHGVVAMSQSTQSPPGHAGSGFFVIVAKPWLDFSGVYAPLGTVDRGLEVVERISELGPPDKYAGTGNIGATGKIGKLRRPVLIEGIAIQRG